MQTKISSLKESAINIAIGYVVALLSQLAIFPVFGVHLPLHQNMLIGVFFTAISLIRSYTIRRWFNRKAATQYTHKDQVIALIKNDSWAITFQTMGQYRTALIKAIREAA
jgi:membrane protein implicated in regulation of membrane protease activity